MQQHYENKNMRNIFVTNHGNNENIRITKQNIHVTNMGITRTLQ